MLSVYPLTSRRASLTFWKLSNELDVPSKRVSTSRLTRLARSHSIDSTTKSACSSLSTNKIGVNWNCSRPRKGTSTSESPGNHGRLKRRVRGYHSCFPSEPRPALHANPSLKLKEQPVVQPPIL